MATVCARPAPLSQRSSTPPLPHSQQTLSINTSTRGTPAAVPNKHIPVCSPGPRPRPLQISTPPASPPTASPTLELPSLLYPPDEYPRVSSKPTVYGLTVDQLSQALDHIASQPLPDPKQVFPWLHGLHPENGLQLAFFIARRKTLRRSPRCIRSLTIVKAGGDLTHSKLKGAIGPDELLSSYRNGDDVAQFLEHDPRDGFSVRNFQIQAAKMATVSDIVVYGDDKTPRDQVRRLAERIARAQKAWRERDREMGTERAVFSTFVLQDKFETVEKQHPEIVCLDRHGCVTGQVTDFFHSERVEMHTMSTATEISKNVWLGPTPEPGLVEDAAPLKDGQRPKSLDYDVLIEATDMAQMPDRGAFRLLEDLLENDNLSKASIPQLEFPGSGSIMPPTWSQAEVDGLMQTCAWIYRQAHGLSGESQAVSAAENARKRKDSRVQITPPSERDSDGDSIMASTDLSNVTLSDTGSTGRTFLLHCTDGYTETTMLALAYYMYANCVPLHTAYIELHTKHKRNFFAYPTDVALLTTIQPRILQSSPACNAFTITELNPLTPSWMSRMDGSLPSRVMDYMYLGNLGHANNPGLLKELGIGQVLSVGEPVAWSSEDLSMFDSIGGGPDRVMFIDKVQDNGVDPLTEEFPRCLAFIEKGRRAGTATLVHCRVGVSRSATICIAEVMNELGLSLPRAYCFVRARRLNVIIQPHLRFAYELLKWEESQCLKRGKPLKRELEWASIAREIAAMNKPYSRQ